MWTGYGERQSSVDLWHRGRCPLRCVDAMATCLLAACTPHARGARYNNAPRSMSPHESSLTKMQPRSSTLGPRQAGAQHHGSTSLPILASRRARNSLSSLGALLSECQRRLLNAPWRAHACVAHGVQPCPTKGLCCCPPPTAPGPGHARPF